MKTFRQLRETSVYKKKINKIAVEIKKDSKGFTAYVDGDMLDTFKSQSEAEKAAKTVVKELT